jgi:transcriptional regulator with XRE-family HTH domain
VATRERAKDRGRRLGFRALARIGEELRLARTTNGTSRRELGASASVSRTTEARYESGRFEAVTVIGAAELLAAAGLGLSVSIYPLGDPPRDRRHADLGATLLSHVTAPLTWRTEVPLPNPGDARSWDIVVYGQRKRTGTEIVRVMSDLQALSRRVALKRRDGGVDYLLVVIEDTPFNRRIVRESPTFLPELARFKTGDVIRALQTGQHPGDGVVLLKAGLAPTVHTTRA